MQTEIVYSKAKAARTSRGFWHKNAHFDPQPLEKKRTSDCGTIFFSAPTDQKERSVENSDDTNEARLTYIEVCFVNAHDE